MHYFKLTLSTVSAAFLAACSTTTPTGPTLPDVPSVGAAVNTSGTYSIVTNGVTHTMTGAITPNAATNTLAWHNGGGVGTMKGSGFETADVLALSAMNTTGANETFAGITGTPGTVPAGGTATYTGSIGFQLLEPANTTTGPVVKYFGLTLNVNVDFDASTLSGTGNFNSSLQGNIVGSEFTGTVSAQGGNAVATTVPMQGGFYGTNGGTIAAAFAGTGLSGVFSGTVSP